MEKNFKLIHIIMGEKREVEVEVEGGGGRRKKLKY